MRMTSGFGSVLVSSFFAVGPQRPILGWEAEALYRAGRQRRHEAYPFTITNTLSASSDTSVIVIILYIVCVHNFLPTIGVASVWILCYFLQFDVRDSREISSWLQPRPFFSLVARGNFKINLGEIKMYIYIYVDNKSEPIKTDWVIQNTFSSDNVNPRDCFTPHLRRKFITQTIRIKR